MPHGMGREVSQLSDLGFKQSFQTDLGFIAPLSLQAFCISLLLAAFLSYICVKIYIVTSVNKSKKMKKTEYQELMVTIVLLSPTVATIILVVGRNLAHAFALMGMLSLIRFRNPSKGPGDLIFLLLAIAIGMTCGAQYFGMAIQFTIITCIFLLAMNGYYNWQARRKALQDDSEINPPPPPTS